MMRIIFTLLALLFGYATVLQLNDPDSLRWAAFYAAAAVVSLVTTWAWRRAVVPVVMALVALIWACTLAPSVIREAAFTWNEAERELGGLIIVLLAMVLLAFWASRPAPERSQSQR